MNREEALVLVKEHVKGEFLIKHMLAAEAIMRGVAKFLGEDAKTWALVGLLHDIDFEEIGENYSKHGIRAAEILEGKVEDDILHAIKSHNWERTGVKPENKMEVALIAADAMTGLIIAAALVKGKRLSNVTVDTVRKCFKKKDFARGSNRDAIKKCEEIGIPLEKFFEISLKSMQDIAGELGL